MYNKDECSKGSLNMIAYGMRRSDSLLTGPQRSVRQNLRLLNHPFSAKTASPESPPHPTRVPSPGFPRSLLHILLDHLSTFPCTETPPLAPDSYLQTCPTAEFLPPVSSPPPSTHSHPLSTLSSSNRISNSHNKRPSISFIDSSESP